MPDARALPTLFGVALTVRGRLGGDGHPARALRAVDRVGRGRAHLFADLDDGLAARLEPGDRAGRRLGSRARRGRRGGGAGARCRGRSSPIVAASFADGFDEHCLAAGMPPLEVDAPAIFHTGASRAHQLRGGHDREPVARRSSADPEPHRARCCTRLRALLGR